MIDEKKDVTKKAASPAPAKKFRYGIAAYFAACAAMAGGGTGMEVYADQKQGGSLAHAYALAAECEAKSKDLNASCPLEQRIAIQQKTANEELRKTGNNVQWLGIWGGALGFVVLGS